MQQLYAGNYLFHSKEGIYLLWDVFAIYQRTIIPVLIPDAAYLSERFGTTFHCWYSMQVGYRFPHPNDGCYVGLVHGLGPVSLLSRTFESNSLGDSLSETTVGLAKKCGLIISLT
jgi:hypothetical protein